MMPTEREHVRLSVVIPTVDRPTLLPRAVRSVVEAGCAACEVIVVDDGKTPPDASLSDMPGVRVITNTGRKGAPSARNLGVESARGEVILFLDDDEMKPHYPQRVLDIASGAQGALWGASAVTVKYPDGRTEVAAHKLSPGLQQTNRNFRRKIFAASAGFWVRRNLYIESGRFDPDLWLEDDTEFCCRMLGAGHEPWYETEPGVVIHRNWSADGHTGQLTRVTRPEWTLACYLATFQRHARSLADYPGASYFLAHRLVRRATAFGLPVDVPNVLSELPGTFVKARLLAYWAWRKIEKRGDRE